MHIGLNAQLLSLSQDYRATGISWYVYNLLGHLPAGQHRYTVFTAERRAAELWPQLRVRLTRWPTRNPLVRIFWEQVLLPLHLAREGVDLLHGLGFVIPLASRRPGVITIFDLGFVVHPELIKPARRIYLSTMARLSAQRARRIIAISQATKQDIVRLWGIDPQRVVVIPCGVEERFRPPAPEALEAWRRRRSLPEHMILFLGTLEPRKNIPGLLRAYALLRSRGLRSHMLVLAGAAGWGQTSILAEMGRLGLNGQVFLPGYVPSEELPLWYAAADLFVYPSLYEGFGLPVLEAMACGTPVIAADGSALPEVVGEAGLLVSPTDVEALAEAIQRALQDPSLREAMRGKGLLQARRFSWAEAGRRTAQVYEEATTHERGGDV
ncbi:MAG: glycosyltransferase family 4 protein [Chloroflexi bacterium]|nr:glycosyltransferase family 4 protein [Chloroflexota bacterium]